MKKIIITLFLLFTASIYAQTDVKGNLSENVTWEKAKSPLQCNGKHQRGKGCYFNH